MGTDIVSIARISQQARKDNKLSQRLLTPKEFSIYETYLSRQTSIAYAYLAKRFAAKEATAKALGTGIGSGVSFQHIEVLNNALGGPYLVLSAGAMDRLDKLSSGPKKTFISISDETEFATATVILEAVDYSH